MIEIWTDGASRGNPGLSACGFYCIDESGISHKAAFVFEKSTNNRMEVGAMICAFRFIIKNSWQNKQIKLYSDSAWAIGAVSKNWNINCNLDLVEKARSIIKDIPNIEFIKVKGHADNEGNIIVDQLLNDSMNSSTKIYKDPFYE